MADQDEERERRRAETDRQMAELQQEALRRELSQRETWRDLFEQHERVIGAKARQLRLKRGWTQADLSARLAGLGWPVDQTTISNLELGRRPVRVAEAVALATAFGLPVLALWHLPAEGEPQSIAQMRERLEQIDGSIAATEQAMQRLLSLYADDHFRRAGVIRAMDAAAREGGRDGQP